MLLALGSGACSKSPPHVALLPGHPEAKATVFDNERLVVVDRGSLTRAVTATPAERLSSLSDFLVENRAYFGAEHATLDDLAFAPASDEVILRWGNGDAFAMVAVHQVYRGVRVIDEVQYGAYLLGEDGHGELRRVRAHFHNPKELPSPPAVDPEKRTTAQDIFRKFLSERGIRSEAATVAEELVISKRLEMAGYLGRHFFSLPDGSFSVLAAVIDPETERVSLLYDIPACRAGRSSPTVLEESEESVE